MDWCRQVPSRLGLFFSRFVVPRILTFFGENNRNLLDIRLDFCLICWISGRYDLNPTGYLSKSDWISGRIFGKTVWYPAGYLLKICWPDTWPIPRQYINFPRKVWIYRLRRGHIWLRNKFHFLGNTTKYQNDQM